MNAKLFINYRREDTAPHAGRLYDRLSAHFGEEQVFIDIDQIEPGEDFVEAINRKVSACDVAIVAIGPHWLHATNASGKRRLDDEEDFVRMEIVAALQRKIRVIPVLVGGAQMPGRHDLPEALAPLSRRNAIELSETRFHDDVNRLIEAIEKSFAVAEKKAELSATPIKEPTTPMKSTQTTQPQPIIPSAASISEIAALTERAASRRKRLIRVTAVAAMVILLLLLMISALLTRPHPSITTSHPSPTTPHPSVGPPSENDYAEAMELTTGVGGTRIDLPKAAEYLQRAAAKNEPEAEARLAYWVKNGVGGLAKDNGKAEQWAKKALADGLTAKATNNVEAQAALAMLYEFGLGVSKDIEKAADLYQKAADQGYAGAQSNLGRFYETGQGVPKDLSKAAELFQKAADQGNADAQNRLGRLYQSGRGVTRDLWKAAELYQKAADQGNARAQYHLGWLFELGDGVPKDLGKAVELYQKAANQGDQDAITSLQRLSGYRK